MKLVKNRKLSSGLWWKIHIVTTPSRFLKETTLDFPWAKIYMVKANGEYNSLSYNVDFLIKAVRTIETLIQNILST